MEFALESFVIAYLLLIAFAAIDILLSGRTAKDLLVTAVAAAMSMTYSICVTTGILFAVCRFLPSVGITSVIGRPVEFSWPLTAAVWYVITIVKILKGTILRRAGV